MRFLPKDRYVNRYNPDNPPALTVASGEVVQLETPSILAFIETFPDSRVLPVIGPGELQDTEPGLILNWIQGSNSQSTIRVSNILTQPPATAFYLVAIRTPFYHYSFRCILFLLLLYLQLLTPKRR